MNPVIPSADALRDFIAAILCAAGSSEIESTMVAENLVMANLCGHDSHGVGMIPRYITSVLAGELKPNSHVRIVADMGALLTLDGERGYGQVIGREAMQIAIPRAQQYGVAVLALRNSYHLARIGQWAEDCAAAGLISIHFVNAVLASALVAPWGGSDARVATNPFCVGIPRDGKPPVVLDFATSRIALGKVRVAMNKGEPVGEGILSDHTGAATTDPRVMFPDASGQPIGAVLPFGEHKGSGLALVCELLGAALTGGDVQVGTNSGSAIINNMLSIVIDPTRLDQQNRFHREMERFIDWMKASPAAPGVDQVLIAGEPERHHRSHRERDGIPIDANTWGELLHAAERVGLHGHGLQATPPPRA